MTKQIQTHNLGFPRIGGNRELKRALESYWRGELDQAGLEAAGRKLRQAHWQLQADAGMDLIPCGDFAWYDQVLTMSATLGNIPARHRNPDNNTIDLDTLFRVARGRAPTGTPAAASDMTKWFDTNYHYIVPEFSQQQTFSLEWRQIINETREAVAMGFAAKPVLIGPVSYLWLGKEVSPHKEPSAGKKPSPGKDFDRLQLLPALLETYLALLQALSEAGAHWVQIDEPILSLDLPAAWQRAFDKAYFQLQRSPVKILLANYFGGLEENLQTALNLPVAAFHIDATRAPAEIKPILDWLPQNKILSVGIIDGRNVWRNNLRQSLLALESAQSKLGDRLWLAPSCSLLHVPMDLDIELDVPPALHDWLAFAKQKLHELTDLNRLLRASAGAETQVALDSSDRIARLRHDSPLRHNPDVQARLRLVQASDTQRNSTFAKRYEAQQRILQLPAFPTTTIGSFPQTAAIRHARRQFKSGQLGHEDYKTQMKTEICEAIRRQESLDIDVLVHGEAERNDMVEYFGEQLDGYLFTQYGWVQSYGSRCVKPPIIYGDIQRRQAMTLDWITYAQSLTTRPVKGMLTGPITMLSWSFVRDDQPRETTAMQIALALRDEVSELEAAGVRIIQVDEPAIREGLPLRKAQHPRYLDWAVTAFRLATCCVADETQIHTHMCYSEFNDIIDAIAALDADVITIETSRSNGELLQAFEDYRYPNAIGPGVYDIHSPNVPAHDAMIDIMQRAAMRIPTERLWVNPDCGLKTRGWPETEAALGNMVAVAKALRQQYPQN